MLLNLRDDAPVVSDEQKSVEVVVEDGQVRATFDPRSFEVVCAMRKGQENPRALSDSDKRTYDMNNGTNYGSATLVRNESSGPSGDSVRKRENDSSGSGVEKVVAPPASAS